MTHERDQVDPAADKAAIDLAARIRAGDGLALLLDAIARHDDHISHRAMHIVAELDREAFVDLTAESIARLAGMTGGRQATGW